MTTAKVDGHTPGPWKASDVRYNREFRTCLNVMTQDGLRFVAAVSCDPFSDRQQLEANAALVAAAPDLLAAVRIAEQLASIASDWNLDEVEIDGAMRPTFELRDMFRQLRTRALAQEGK